MRKFLLYIFLLFVPLFALAQQSLSLEIDAASLAPIHTDALTGVAIDKIEPDYSKRPCARIKLHINRMSREDINGISVKVIGGNVVVMKRLVAAEGNGLIIELTAKPETRFYLHHDKYGDSNTVNLNLEGDKEYRLNAQLNILQSVVVSSNVVGADVYIDNEYKGRTDESFALTVDKMMHGSHDLRIVYGGVKNEKKVEVNATSIYFRIEVDTAASEAQFVAFEVTPKDAVVEIDGKNWILDKFGTAQNLLNNGTYHYTISAKDYHSETGTFVVNGKKVEKIVKLSLAHGWLKVSGEGALQGARVLVDDALVGNAPIVSHKLSSGVHDIRVVKDLYKTFIGKIEIKDGETLEFTPKLDPDFAHVTVKAEAGCDLYINGVHKGVAMWSGNLSSGTYRFEARKENYHTYAVTKTIAANPQKQNYDIPALTPIEGTLVVMSTPAISTVYVDDIEVGRTPVKIPLIIGMHKVRVEKEGFSNEHKEVKIEKSKTTELKVALTPRALTRREIARYNARKRREIYAVHENGFGSMINLSYALRWDDWYGLVNSHVSLNYIAGYQFNNYMYLGAGTGLTYNFNWGPWPPHGPVSNMSAQSKCMFSVPMFAYFRANFLNRRFSPFVAMSAGVDLSAKQTLQLSLVDVKYNTITPFINPQIGLNFRTSTKTSVYFAIGYQGMVLPYCYSYTPYSAVVGYKYYSGFDFHFGLTF